METPSISSDNSILQQPQNVKLPNPQEASDKNGFKDSSTPMVPDVLISSKCRTNKEKKVFQIPTKNKNIIKVPEDSNEIEVPSVLIDNEKFETKNVTIEIKEEKDSTPVPKKRGRKKKEKTEKPDEKKKIHIARGYNAFIFYEKEKFKGINLKEINQREYVSQISAEWRQMTDEEKEPYLKMAADYKNQIEQNGGEPFMTKQRKRSDKKKKINVKKEKEEISVVEEKRKQSDCTPNSVDEKEIKREKCDINDEKQKMLEFTYEFICSVFVPILKKSCDFCSSKGKMEFP